MIRQIIEAQATGYIGDKNDLELIMCALLNSGHVLMEGPPGLGKTKLSHTISESLGGSFNRIQFTPDILPSDVTGIKFFHPGTQQFEIKKGPVFTNILLADEINRATPKTQSSLLQAMQEQEVTIDDTTYALPAPFIVLATQNPAEHQQGTFPLPQAQMDRFMIRLYMDYPSVEDEMRIISGSYADKVSQVLPDIKELKQYAAEKDQVFCHEDIIKYIAYIIHHTRTDHEITEGLSPRAGIHIAAMAKAYAYINQRDYVIPDDVKKVFPYVTIHRLKYTHAQQNEASKRMILNRLLGEINVPTL